MKKVLIILLIFIMSCSTSSRKKTTCTENKIFRNEFFDRISYIKKNIFSHQDSSFKNSLIFISNYAPVSFYETMNYARIYPPQAFKKDKKNWLEWYEENKCNNIQLKEKHLIPEQYKEFFEN